VDLCPTDPGFPIDIYITTDIRTMVHVWVGELSLEAAVQSERIEGYRTARTPSEIAGLVFVPPHEQA
jgi:hypothetical protein